MTGRRYLPVDNYIALVTALYFSRCNEEAVKRLNYRSAAEAFREIGKIINVNPNSIRQMRDEFDPYFENGRIGHKQAGLCASRKKVYDECMKLNDNQLHEKVSLLLEQSTALQSKKSSGLINLRLLIDETKDHYLQNYTWEDVELSESFKGAFSKYLEKKNSSIEYFENTSVITTSSLKNIFVPNQWFVIASYGVGVCKELYRYKDYLIHIAEICGEDFKSLVLSFKSGEAAIDKELFFEKAKLIFSLDGYDEYSSEKSAEYLYKFASNYFWWSGQKSIDRGDFYISVILNMLNLLAASQGYVADITYAYYEDPELMAMTKDLGAFTMNLSGETYDFAIPEDVEKSEEHQTIEGNQKFEQSTHHITISAGSLKKLNKQ